MVRSVFAALLGFVLLGCGASTMGARGVADARAVESSRAEDLGPEASRLLVALDVHLTVWQRPDGTRVHVRHCRNAPSGCPARLVAFARLLAEAAERHGLDPMLLAAVAMRESGFNPGAVGGRGEAGILQLHPGGVGRDIRFVQDASYRESCVARAAACQEPVIERGARYLAEAIERCGGIEAGLGKYNTGRCGGRRVYVERILRERERLLSHIPDSYRSK